ncbi:hypothetical protein QZM39_25855, partial [Burkholderia cenocepacia]|uniref:hypothetical protein n=1 Tax=Burkholderia cenocepacia TaxID=95486 RepID=UPI00264C69AF
MASTIGGLGFRAGARDLRLGRRRDPVLRARRRLGRRFGARCREARGGGFDARVTSPQQVMLEVKVAEVSKTLINQMG